jgi:2-desacetyl-2-hydroxyethyl bacteriochlorophyllide A dehydrogenase
MKAIRLEQPGHLQEIEQAEPGSPGPGDVLVRIHQVGVCGTDFHAYQGNQPFFTYPRVLGHELGVEVLTSGEQVQGLPGGTRCALEPYFSCGDCPACRRGTSNCCLYMQVFGVHIDGGMREYAHVPARSLHPSSRLSFEQLALVEPLAIGAHAVSRARLHPGEQVLIVGAGPIGLAVTQFALLAGTQVMVLDINEQRLRFCQERWPQVVCLNGQGDALATLTAHTGEDLPMAVFDATGNGQSMRSAFNFTGHGGRLIFVGLFQGDVTFADPDFHKRELTLLSSRNATAGDFQRVITALEAGQIDLAPWITHHASSETMTEQFPSWFQRESGLIKALVAF